MRRPCMAAKLTRSMIVNIAVGALTSCHAAESAGRGMQYLVVLSGDASSWAVYPLALKCVTGNLRGLEDTRRAGSKISRPFLAGGFACSLAFSYGILTHRKRKPPD